MVKLLLLLLICVASAEAQVNQIPPDDCTRLLKTNLDTIPVKDTKSKGKQRKSADLNDALIFVINSISAANCKMTQKPRFLLNTADLDFQTFTDDNGSLEILAIGGLALGLDKQTTTDSDFTFSVPTPVNAMTEAAYSKKPDKPKQPLADAIVAAMDQMSKNFNVIQTLSQHQVKVSIKYALTKDGTLEVEPSFGILGITGKFTKTSTDTQTLTLTFADMVPNVALSFDPASTTVNLGQTTTKVSLVATVTSPNYSNAVPTGKVTFTYDDKTVDVELDNMGVAVAPVELTMRNHLITAAYSGDQNFDKAASTPSLLIVK